MPSLSTARSGPAQGCAARSRSGISRTPAVSRLALLPRLVSGDLHAVATHCHRTPPPSRAAFVVREHQGASRVLALKLACLLESATCRFCRSRKRPPRRRSAGTRAGRVRTGPPSPAASGRSTAAGMRSPYVLAPHPRSLAVVSWSVRAAGHVTRLDPQSRRALTTSPAFWPFGVRTYSIRGGCSA